MSARAVTTQSLWREPAFLRLWVAQFVSGLGSQVTLIALPITAVIVLHASPAQMGLLQAGIFLPNLVFGLIAGVWVDRVRRGPIMIGADAARAILLGSIPLAAVLHRLSYTQLVVVGFTSGSFTVFFEVASTSLLPSVVDRARLLDANSKLAMGDSLLSVAGPSLGGGLVQLLSAPKAVAVDAASYIASALTLRGLGRREQRRTTEAHPSAHQSIVEGLRALLQTPLLRALTISSGMGSFCIGLQNTVLVLFLVRNLHLGASGVGLVFAAGGAGSLLGAALSSHTSSRIGPGRAIIAGTALTSAGSVLVPVAGILALPFWTLIAVRVLVGVGTAVYSVNQLTLRQTRTPVALLGRVNAARRFLVFSVMPVGSLIGGILAAVIGTPTTLLVGAVGFASAVIALLCSPEVMTAQNATA